MVTVGDLMVVACGVVLVTVVRGPAPLYVVVVMVGPWVVVVEETVVAGGPAP